VSRALPLFTGTSFLLSTYSQALQDDENIDSMIETLDEVVLSDYAIENKNEFRMMIREIYSSDLMFE